MQEILSKRFKIKGQKKEEIGLNLMNFIIGSEEDKGIMYK